MRKTMSPGHDLERDREYSFTVVFEPLTRVKTIMRKGKKGFEVRILLGPGTQFQFLCCQG